MSRITLRLKQQLIVSLPSDMARDANPVKPLIIPCQSAQAGVAGGQAGRLVMEETLRGWWNVGCKVRPVDAQKRRPECMCVC